MEATVAKKTKVDTGTIIIIFLVVISLAILTIMATNSNQSTTTTVQPTATVNIEKTPDNNPPDNYGEQLDEWANRQRY